MKHNAKDHRDCLLHAFSDELQSLTSGVMLNAAPLDPAVVTWARAALTCEQGFKPLHDALAGAGYRVAPSLEAQAENAFAIVLASRSRALNERNIARAWHAVAPGSPIFITGTKSLGIQAIRKWLGGFCASVDARSKYHAISLRVERAEHPLAIPQGSNDVNGWQIAVGSFSADGPDAGSRLLAEHMTPHLRGRIADLGAGWGYLSVLALKQSEAVSKVDLYEAEWVALEAARENLTRNGFEETRWQTNWCDVTRELPKIPYDTVIMNPPVHHSLAGDQRTDTGLGQRFIEMAARNLVGGGKLVIVANRNLPYERILNERFRRVESVIEADGFKVMIAVK